MNESKELLEATIKGLEEKISQLNDEVMMKTKELEDVNKPELTALQMDIINDAVDSALSSYELDCGHFDYEFEMDYENRIQLNNLSFTDTYDLAEAVIVNIERHFKIIKDEQTNE